MNASYQPQSGLPVDAGPVAYVVLALNNGDCFKLLESPSGDGLVMKYSKCFVEPAETQDAKYCDCTTPWLPIGGWGCERCGKIVQSLEGKMTSEMLYGVKS